MHTLALHLPAFLADSSPPQDGSSMWAMNLKWWEFVVRALLVYVFLLVILRLTGKRQIGQLAPFDLVLLLVLSNAVQNSMNGGDNSVVGGFISAATLIALNAAIGYLTYKNRKVEDFIEGQPRVLIHDGKLYKEALRDERLSHQELMTALRGGGCSSISQVRLAVLEPDGQITVIPRKQDA